MNWCEGRHLNGSWAEPLLLEDEPVGRHGGLIQTEGPLMFDQWCKNGQNAVGRPGAYAVWVKFLKITYDYR